MKYPKIIILSMLLLCSLLSFSQWEWQNPLPQGNTLKTIFFINEYEGWAGGNNTIIHTTDGGASWNFQDYGEFPIIYDICFIDDHTGIAVGGYPYCWRVILKTYNNGNDWIKVLEGGNHPLYDVFFLDDSNFMAVGSYGEILCSFDGGENWQLEYTTYYNNYNAHFNSCWLFSVDEGWIVGDNGIVLKKDSDSSWYDVELNTNLDLLSIYFTDKNHGIISGEDGVIFYTEDGGTIWDSIPSYTTFDLRDIQFCGKDTGWIMGRDILYTTNGGQSWSIKDMSGYSGCFLNDDLGYITSGREKIFRTDDGGNQWNEISSGFSNSIRDIYFIDENIGWAAVHPSGECIIIHTNDGGENWEAIDTIDYFVDAMTFVDELNGWIVGFGHILHTSDGGFNWDVQFNHPIHESFRDICFIDLEYGWAISDYDTIRLTQNGGITWQTVHLDCGGFNKGCFIDKYTGWIVGNWGNIKKTIDGGFTWIEISPNTNWEEYESVYFVDENIGWVVGGDNIILHTEDGGLTWEYQSDNYPRTLYDVSFVDSLHGWICGSYGEMFHTSDGGENWEDQQTFCTQYLYNICFVDENNGWAAGMYGAIIHTGNGGIVGFDTYSEAKKNMDVFVFPNPFKNSLNIELGKICERGVLSIYDMKGNIIWNESIRGEKSKTINLSDVESGVYLINLWLGNERYSTKVIKK